MFDAIQGLGETLTAHAVNRNLTFPFVTLPMFEVAGQHARTQSRNELLSFAPFVGGDEKEAWERYALENQGWIEQGRKIRLESDQNAQVTSFVEGSIPTNIVEFTASGDVGLAPPGRDSYSPVWQMSPVPFSTVSLNFNLQTFAPAKLVMDAVEILKGTLRLKQQLSSIFL